jgi:hypothetical protein
VAQLKYMLMIQTNQNLLYKEINRRLNSGNACLIQNLFSSNLLSKSIKIRIVNSIIFPLVLYGYETWSLILMEECSIRVFENRVLRRILD